MRTIRCDEHVKDYYKNIEKRLMGDEETNVNQFIKAAFPLLRRVYLPLMAHDILSVQPMTGPSSNLFDMCFKSGSIK